ncbi:hypothetical protein Mapa_006085 [Marchantia paleacea]|nr:hypothetical protein Mapa_006085 [Marchantia paleacea]
MGAAALTWPGLACRLLTLLLLLPLPLLQREEEAGGERMAKFDRGKRERRRKKRTRHETNEPGREERRAGGGSAGSPQGRDGRKIMGTNYGTPDKLARLA